MYKLRKLVLLLPLLWAVNKPPLAVKAATRPTNINMSAVSVDDLETYYQSVASKKGDSLVRALNSIIKNHDEYSYTSNSDREIYKIIDRNWALSPLTATELTSYNYSDNPYIFKLYGNYNDDQNTAYRFHDPKISGRVSFDKEHIWAQSLGNFGRTNGAGSDFHALWPSDIKGNQSGHSNYSFGVPTKNRTEVKNDAGGVVGWNGYIDNYPNKVFEPLDEWKGDIARAMFYMPARYYTYENATHPKLILVNDSPSTHTASASNPGKGGVLSDLLAWNELDPVSEHERLRNNLIYNNYQKNRNPFIDYPEWARIAYDPSYQGSGVNFGSDEDDPTSEVPPSSEVLPSSEVPTSDSSETPPGPNADPSNKKTLIIIGSGAGGVSLGAIIYFIIRFRKIRGI